MMVGLMDDLVVSMDDMIVSMDDLVVVIGDFLKLVCCMVIIVAVIRWCRFVAVYR